MRRFETVHEIPGHGLRAIHTGDPPELQPLADEYVQKIVEACPGLTNVRADISWKNMSGNTLGYAHTYFERRGATWFPTHRFQVYLNPRVQWWNGTCAAQPSHHYDMDTVVLHEILHGIGFLSTVDSEKSAFPSDFDMLIQDSSGQSLVTSEGVYTGDFGQAVYIDQVRLYNPSPYNEGSSLSHVYRSRKVMSWYQSSCHRTLDEQTARVLRRLGYGCVRTWSKSYQGTDSWMWVGIGIGVVVVVIVAISFGCRRTGRKKRVFEPLLS